MKMTKQGLLLAAALTAGVAQADFAVTSTDIRAGATMPLTQVFNSFGCTGGNVSPSLAWSGAPAGTRSFAVTIYDPDAPTGSGWWHWLVINLPASTKGFATGASPAGLPAGAVETRTDFGKPGYGGPCPPVGDKPHHYIVTVYALKTDKIDLGPDTPAAMVGYFLNQQKLATASLTALYAR